MALTCNAFAAITANQYRDAMQAASIQRPPQPVYPVLPDNWRAALLVGLNSIAAGKGITIDLSKIDQADLVAVTRNLNLAIEGTNDKFPDLDNDTFQSIVLYVLNQILCS